MRREAISFSAFLFDYFHAVLIKQAVETASTKTARQTSFAPFAQPPNHLRQEQSRLQHLARREPLREAAEETAGGG